MEEIEGELGRISMKDINPHWRFIKPNSGLTATEDFVSDLHTINEALAKPHGDPEPDNNADEPLPSIDDIIRDINNNNHVQRPTPEASEAVEELLDSNGVDLLNVNSPRIVKSKGRPTGAKNKKGIMSRAEKAKAKSTKRDLSSFEHVDASIRALRGGKVKGGRRGGRGGAASTSTSTATARSKAVRKSLKALAPFNAASIEADRLAFEKEHEEIAKDIRGIITRQTMRKTVAKAFASNATGKGAIHIDSDADFNGEDDAASTEDWMYDMGD